MNYALLDRFVKLAKEDENHYSAGLLFYCPDDASIFLVKRGPKMNNPNLWDIPGGKNSENDNTPLFTAEREAIEEIGKLPENKKYISEYIIDNDRPYHIFIFSITAKEKEDWTKGISLDYENQSHGWFKLTELPKDMHFRLDWLEDLIKHACKNKTLTKLSSIKKYAQSIIPARFEYKFFVNQEEAKEIRDYIKPFVKADDHGQFYNIKNIYLDNSQLKLYNDHLTSNDRFKLRIRFYDNDDQAFFEIKKKANKNITKYRYIVSPKYYDEMINSNELPFSKIANDIGAAPFMLINYDREAYEGDNKGRITIDSNIKYSVAKNYNRTQKAIHALLPNDLNVLELKFNGTMPQYMGDLIFAFDLKRIPMSKYITAVSDAIYDFRS